jgi:hypothetical protein
MTLQRFLFTVLALACAEVAAKADNELCMQWNMKDGSTGGSYCFTEWQKITYDAEGNATVFKTDGSSDSFVLSKVKKVVFTWRTLTGAPDLPAGFHAFPNPVAEVLILESGDPLERIFVQDLNGRTIQSHQTKETRFSLNLSNLPQGLYLIRAGGKTSKIIKN